MCMAKRIRELRIQKGLTQEELAIKLGLQKSAIAKYENGRVENIKRSTIEKMAEILGVSPSYLMGWEDKLSTDVKRNKGVKINVLGEVAAGIPIEAIENIIDTEEIPESVAKTGEFFGLRIKGDSMAPRILEGDTVIVRKQEDADSGDVVIALINGDSATCKKLIKYTHGISLVAFNLTYDPLTFTNKEIQELPVRIIGKVIENRQKY